MSDDLVAYMYNRDVVTSPLKIMLIFHMQIYSVYMYLNSQGIKARDE